jgi:sarcosine oxidase subunit beta
MEGVEHGFRDGNVSATFHNNPASIAGHRDVTIVGGGIVGLATAFFLSRLGIRPLIIERLPTPASLTSRRSGEGVRAQWGLRHNIDIARASIEFYADFGNRIGMYKRNAGYRPVGYLYASRTPDGATRLKSRFDMQRAAGLDDLEYVEPADVRRRFPLLSDTVTGAVFRASDGVVVVSDIVAGYLAAMNADILLGAEVRRIGSEGADFAIETSCGTVRCANVILADGARLPAMLDALGISVPLRLARSSIFHVKTDGIPFDHPATIDVDLGSFWRPDAGGARMTASFRSTLFLDTFTDDPAPDPDYMAHAIATVSPLVPRWAEIAPSIADSHARHGSFAVSGDGAPLIGPIDAIPGLFINGAYGGHGIMMSADGGRRLAEIVAGKQPGASNPFHPSRFATGTMPAPEPMTVNTNDALKETR